MWLFQLDKVFYNDKKHHFLDIFFPLTINNYIIDAMFLLSILNDPDYPFVL